MEKNNTSDRKILEEIVAKLFAAAEEIEQLASTLSGGDGPATDEFENIKDDFARKLASVQGLIPGGEEGDALRLAVGDLRETLSKGAAHDRNTFVQQKQNILFALSSVGKNSLSIGRGQSFLELEHEIEKLKLKLEILALR